MEQNPEVPKIEWHFICDEGPYCVSIKREDMCQEHAVQLIMGSEDSAYYYDLKHRPATTEDLPVKEGDSEIRRKRTLKLTVHQTRRGRWRGRTFILKVQLRRKRRKKNFKCSTKRDI